MSPDNATSDNELEIYKELGDKWPLTVKKGTVGCQDHGCRHCQAAFFLHNGKKYALNGVAGARKSTYHSIDPIWADDGRARWVDDPETGERVNVYEGLKKNIGPLIDLALKKCR